MFDCSIIVLNLDNKLDIQKLSNFVKSKIINAEIIIASTKKHQIYDVNEYIFDTDCQDSVINTLVKEISSNKLIIVRKIDNNNFNPIISVYKGLTKTNQICLLKKKSNKFIDFFKKIRDKILNFLLGYTYLDGSISCVGFTSCVIEILKKLDNLSMYTKINKWSGIEIKEIEASDVSKVSFKPKIKKHLIRLAIQSVVLIAPLLLWIFVKFIQNYLPLKILCMFLILFSLCLIAIECIMISVKFKVGDNIYDQAEIKN